MEEVLAAIRKFRDERDWLKFHDPQNLAVSVAIEAAELLEEFQWKDRDAAWRHAEQNREAVADEIADVAIYLYETASAKTDIAFAALTIKDLVAVIFGFGGALAFIVWAFQLAFGEAPQQKSRTEAALRSQAESIVSAKEREEAAERYPH